jgi:uncharacterized membrane protein YphA (DoxX/SURF4 family)
LLDAVPSKTGYLLQRLYSTFPCGVPGVGLLLLRAIIAIPLILTGLTEGPSMFATLLEVAAVGAAVLILVGLLTPIVGVALTVMELYLAFVHPADPWRHLHFGVLSASLAMLGPGGCSIDARLYGRKRIQIPQREY